LEELYSLTCPDTEFCEATLTNVIKVWRFYDGRLADLELVKTLGCRLIHLLRVP
jgi:hypothetical protein